MNAAALEVRGLSVWTGSGRRLVDDIGFSIEAGCSTGLVGESGCGKTLTALAILGLPLAPGINVESAGISIGGRDISRLNPRQRRALLGRDIAMVFQQPGTALDPVFTIGQQLSAVVRRHGGSSRKQARRTMLESLAEVGFRQPGEIAAAYPHQLSGGMRQLAMIAMATICKPAVIIADEPTTALDGSTRALILQKLSQLQKRNHTAVLLISHDLEVVRQNCNQVMVMYCGRLLEKAACCDLEEHVRHPYSAGLLSCIPRIGGERPAVIKSIPGQLPAAELPPGCHFAPRCSRAEPRCRNSVPGFVGDDTAGVACFRPLS